MDYIFQTGIEQKHILYAMGEHIVMRRIQSEFMSRPTYLAHDHAANLYGTFLDNAIYYSYITTNGTLILKGTSENRPIFQLDADECHCYTQVFLTSFNEYIVLFYCVRNPLGNTFDLKYVICDKAVVKASTDNNAQGAASANLPQIHSVLSDLAYEPHFSVLNTDTHLILDIHGDNDDSLWEITSDFELISHDEIKGTLKQQSVWQLDKIETLQDEVDKLQQASNLMMNKISALLNENEGLKKENARLQKENTKYSPDMKAQEEKLRSLSDSLAETRKALTIREAQIESAKRQYNELMDVAQKYRDEAIKWRMKLSAH